MIEKTFTLNGCNIAVWSITEDEPSLIALCHEHYIDTSDLATMGNCGCRCQKMAVRLAIHHLINRPFTLTHLPSGAPTVDGIEHISISHTRNYAAVAISQQEAMGIDIEEPSPRVLRVRPRFLSNEEQQHISPTHIQANTLAWTIKEAVYKVLDIEGIDFANGIQLHFSPSGAITQASTCDEMCNISSIEFNQFILTLATNTH